VSVISQTQPIFRDGERGVELARVDGAAMTVLVLWRIDRVDALDQRRTPFFRLGILDAVAEEWAFDDIPPEYVAEIPARIEGMLRALAPVQKLPPSEGITRVIPHENPLDLFFPRRRERVKNVATVANAAAKQIRSAQC